MTVEKVFEISNEKYFCNFKQLNINTLHSLYNISLNNYHIYNKTV